MNSLIQRFDQAGFLVLGKQFASEQLEIFIQDLALIHADAGAGLRDLLNLAPSVRTQARSVEMRRVLETVGIGSARVVRGVYFDKQRDTNWKVAWHQDLTIAVKQRSELPGFNAWTMKAGIQHVQPPTSILEKIVAVRIHLDDADESNGCLRVVPGSHRHGRLNPEQIVGFRSDVGETACVVKKGDVLVMRPLLLHASSIAVEPSHRRVIHLEYSSCDLPAGLEWYED